MKKHFKYVGSNSRADQQVGIGGVTPYSVITDKIIKVLESGTIPWRKPWRGRNSMPCNAVSKRPYHGINLLLLSLAPFIDHRWLTLRQANQLGGHVRSGERASIAVFWKQVLVDEEAEGEKKRSIPFLRYYKVFNAEQCDDLSLPILMDDWQVELNQRIECAEKLIGSMPNPPKILEGGSAACYLPRDDLVRIPKIQDFESPESYYATMFHELGHSTGHESRLNRPGVTGKAEFGLCDYSREELVAELTSAFLCAEIGIDNSTLDQSAGYIQGWLGALAGDVKAVVIAAGQAQRAADFIQGHREGLE